MMKVLSLIFLSFALLHTIVPRPGDIVHHDLEATAVTQELVDQINALPGNTWKASTDQGSFIEGATIGSVKRYLGVKPGGVKLDAMVYDEEDLKDLPDTFDPRTKWPTCPSLNVIRDQSACGTCWAFGAAEAITDRYCTMGLAPNGSISVSSGDIGFCCMSCGDGCDGGYPSNAWQYWVSKGVVDESCYPYPFPSCDHHVPNSKNPCPSDEYPTPNCPNKCGNGQSWSGSKHRGAKAFSVSGQNNLMKELYANGPIEVAFSVYDDFLAYKTGVYKRTSNRFLGGHAVKMMGWGVEGGVKYWLVANSWNPSWGDQGFFKIRRGTDECGIEDEGVAGTPKN